MKKSTVVDSETGKSKDSRFVFIAVVPLANINVFCDWSFYCFSSDSIALQPPTIMPDTVSLPLLYIEYAQVLEHSWLEDVIKL